MPDKFNDKLANRAFKRRVLDMICNSIVQHLSPIEASTKVPIPSRAAYMIG